MPTNLAALQMTPEAMLPTALAALLDPASGVSVSDLVATVSAPDTVQIVPTEMAYLRSDWLYYGHMEAQYDRLDMEDVFGTYDLRVMLDIPSLASDLATLLASIYQVRLTADDIVNEMIPTVEVNGQAYVLKASPTSTMWKGTRTVLLYFTSTQPG